MQIKSAYQTPRRQYPWEYLRPNPTTIGVLWPCYGSGHVIYGLNCRGYTHRRLATLTLKPLDKESTFFHSTPLVLDASVPLVHSWNVIPVNKNFIVSFEYELPRYLGSPTDAQLRIGMRMLEASRCKGMLALSEFAYRHTRRRFERQGFGHLVEKLSVFRGAVSDPGRPRADLGTRPPERPSFGEKPLSAVVIGSELFRKGGMQAIRAFENLRAAGLNVRLTLIGDFESYSYVWSNHIPDAKEWRARAASHDWIRFVSSVPNAKVFDELRAHDICLYPSFDESLGWLTIEAGMLGVPVVGNRICAYPELIQHQRSGWLIDLPVDEDGRWAGVTMEGEPHKAALAEADERVVGGIEDCIRHVYANPHVLPEWGAEARRSMTEMYGMEQASAKLQRIYDRTLERDMAASA
ncbi:MAG TPA: glycosyltransferase family 4 protein [Polyangiaceae bacterium]|jgi:glycosyltransferase involved in cell wall biosynthesis